MLRFHRVKNRVRMSRSIIVILGVILLFFAIAVLTNPYSNPTFIQSPFITSLDKNGNISLEQKAQVHFTTNIFAQKFAETNKAFRFVLSLLFPEQPFSGDEKAIIADIHTERFNPEKPYLITGGHFADIYVRNLGIFYNAVLDNRLDTSKEDWINRQRIATQGMALNLELLRLSGKEYTTFMPIIGTYYTATNVYTEPSDSLFGVLFMLSALRDETFIPKRYPSDQNARYPLQTKSVANKLLKQYKEVLRKTVIDYQNSVLDKRTGLIREDLTLSSARDGIRRESAFYDNVILWATIKMAQDLGIVEKKKDLKIWKEKIITAFWDKQEGLFIDDLSKQSYEQKLFSGDSFIVLGSGFFEIKNAEDTRKLRKMITYVEKNNLAKPFPLLYAKKDAPDKLYGPVKTFAPSYMGETIWSHWGMEYIKALLLLSPEEPRLKKDAEKYLTNYKANIEKAGGYPELYDKSGNLYQTHFYRGVLHTSWVINYEQATILLQRSSD